MYQSAAPTCRSHLRLTVAACQWPIYLSQLSTQREKVSSRTQWESSLDNISKHLCCRVRRQTSRYATVRLDSLLSCDVCCGRFSHSAYTWGNSRKHFFTRSVRRSGAPEEPLQRRCSEMCFFSQTRHHHCQMCHRGQHTQYMGCRNVYFRTPFLTCFLLPGGVSVLLHTAFSNASGLLSSCSAAALEMARSVSSCRCLESFVGDGCSMYSGSCWGTTWGTSADRFKWRKETSLKAMHWMRRHPNIILCSLLRAFLICHYMTY